MARHLDAAVLVVADRHAINELADPVEIVVGLVEDVARELVVVKDGVELARKHRLPQSLIDFIEQHHGTTLVEYFYQEAARQSQENPDSGEVDETTFRYPGPKPQTREAGVMMLADATESASRTLVASARSSE